MTKDKPRITKAKLYNQPVIIEESDRNDIIADNAMGRSDTMRGSIWVQKSLPEYVKMATLMHEVVHYINDVNDCPEITETQVTILANGLLDFLIGNPGLAKRLLKK